MKSSSCCFACCPSQLINSATPTLLPGKDELDHLRNLTCIFDNYANLDSPLIKRNVFFSPTKSSIWDIL